MNAVRKRSYGIVIGLLVVTPAPLGRVRALSAEEIRFIQNDRVRLGVDMDAGGAISYFAATDSKRNVLNHHDRGRYIQQSYYGDQDGSRWNKKSWRWNPVQGGDWQGRPAKVLDSRFSQSSLRIKTRPRHWARGDLLDDTVMSMDVQLVGDLAHISYAFAYSGDQVHRRTDQELPAVFADYALKNLVFYRGQEPWRDKPLTSLIPGWPNESHTLDESWAAYVDDNGWGLGVFTPRMNRITSYRYTGDGKTGPAAAASSYFAPIERMAIKPGFRFDYQVSATIGSIPEIRRRFYELHQASKTASKSAIQVTQRQQVHPVLIRNSHNPLVKVSVESDKPSDFLSELTFSLRGCDHLGDIESLELFLGDADGEFSKVARFGESQRPQHHVTFRGSLRLRKGPNPLWLSCRLSPRASLDRQVDAECENVTTSAGTVSTVRDETPGRRQRIGVALRRHFDDGVHTYRIPALATTPNGTLLCVYDARRRSERDLQEDIDIGLLRSTDGGQSWEPQQIVMDMRTHDGLPEEQNGCSDPGIIVDPETGEIFVFAVWTWGRPGTHQWRPGGSEAGLSADRTSQFMMVRSTNDGATWTSPENLTRQLKRKDWILLAPSPQQGIALSSGVLAMPVQGRNEKDERFSTLMLSDDHGRSWSVQTPYAENNTECQAVELDDGSVMLNCRSDRSVKLRTVIVTPDAGKTWRPHETNRKTLVEPGCNGSLYRIKCGVDARGKPRHALLFANPHSQSGRDHHTLQVSMDSGRTWGRRILLDEGEGRGYPSISRVDGEYVGVVYEGSQADLVFERIPVRQLLPEL